MIAVVGLSHRSAPIEVRERLAIRKERVPQLLRELTAKPAIGEALLLSTCNRVEVVAAPPPARGNDLDAVAEATLECLEAHAPGISQHTYSHTGACGVRHLFRVAASLDSLVLGESQILGQLKDAFQVARRTDSVGSRLNRTIPRAIRAAKRVRTETAIGCGQVSVPTVSVDLARQIFGELAGCTAVLVGAGEMAEAVARLLASEQVRLLVVGRNEPCICQLAAKVGGHPRRADQLDQVLTEADVVITGTSAPGYVVEYERVRDLHRTRRGRSLFFIDLAVPRDVDPRVDRLDRVFVYNIDDFSKVVAHSFSSRQREAMQAEQIVAQEAEGFDRWLDAAEQITPAIVSLRARFSQVLYEELERSLRSRLKHLGPDERAALHRMLDAALNKILHAPTVRVREVAWEHEDGGERADQLLDALVELFELPLPVPTDAGDRVPESRPACSTGAESEPSPRDQAADRADVASIRGPDATGTGPR